MRAMFCVYLTLIVSGILLTVFGYFAMILAQ